MAQVATHTLARSAACSAQPSFSQFQASAQILPPSHPQQHAELKPRHANGSGGHATPKSRLTASLQSACAPCCSTSGAGGGMDELRAILQNSPPPPSYLGMSPPVRSGNSGGAANPLARPDHDWMGIAYNASHSNLQALRELEASSGLSFLSSQFSSPVSFEGGWIDRVPSAIKSAKLQRGSSMACRPQSQAAQLHYAEHGACGM